MKALLKIFLLFSVYCTLSVQPFNVAYNLGPIGTAVNYQGTTSKVGGRNLRPVQLHTAAKCSFQNVWFSEDVDDESINPTILKKGKSLPAVLFHQWLNSLYSSGSKAALSLRPIQALAKGTVPLRLLLQVFLI